MDYETFRSHAENYLEQEIPADFTRDLNGGILVLEDVREDRDGKAYILGEYVQSVMGRQILLYYGSFARLKEEEALDDWKEELEDTIRHELRHHVEALAGQEDLARWEEQQDEDEARQRDPGKQGKQTATRGFWSRWCQRIKGS